MDTTYDPAAVRNRLSELGGGERSSFATAQASASAEIEKLAGSNVDEPTFFTQFIEQAATALQADAAAVWMLDQHGSVGLLSETQLESLGLQHNPVAQQQNTKLLIDVLKSETATVHVPGQSGTAELPTDHVQLLTPISFGGQAIGVVQLFLPTSSPVDQRLDFLQWTEELAAYATRYLTWREEAGSASHHLTFWNQFEALISAIHRSLHPKEVAMTVVNDGRQLLRADRVSLALKNGPQTEITVLLAGLLPFIANTL